MKITIDGGHFDALMAELDWHYRLAEMIRAHAVHARHHLAQMREL